MVSTEHVFYQDRKSFHQLITSIFISMLLTLLALYLLFQCPQIKLIEGELMQLTKLEIKKRSLDAENLQVGIAAVILCPATFTCLFKPDDGHFHPHTVFRLEVKINL